MERSRWIIGDCDIVDGKGPGYNSDGFVTRSSECCIMPKLTSAKGIRDSGYTNASGFIRLVNHTVAVS